MTEKVLKRFRIKTEGNTVDYTTEGLPKYFTTDGARKWRKDTLEKNRTVERRFNKKFG